MDDETIDSRELTPWQETGATRPPALAEQGERHWLSASSFVLRVSADDAIDELSKSLAIVAPTGMTQEDREQWLAVAVEAILDANVSPAVFVVAVKAARIDPACDHPAKVVSAIIRALGDWKPNVINEAANGDSNRMHQATADMHAALWRLEHGEVTAKAVESWPDQWRRIAEMQALVRRDEHGGYRVSNWLANRLAAAA